MSESPPTALFLESDAPLVRRLISETAQAYDLPVTFVDTAETARVVISGPVRMGALLRRIRDAAGGARLRPLTLGRFIFDPADAVLIVAEDGSDIALTEKEVAILSCLAAANGALISRRDLLTNVWGYAEGVETHTLETHIYRLRQKLEHDPAKPEILLTKEQGYSLVIG